jgi:hypothetical protein
MHKQLQMIRHTRAFILNLVSELTAEELNKVPTGFNNNIVWNLAHMVAAQQGICYKRAGLPIIVSEDFFQQYKPDTKPGQFVDSLEIDNIKELFSTTIDQLEKDIAANRFAEYPSWTTRYGVTINSIEEAVTFLLFHEGLHVGYIMALKKLVVKS